jgi:hypothetical protein
MSINSVERQTYHLNDQNSEFKIKLIKLKDSYMTKISLLQFLHLNKLKRYNLLQEYKCIKCDNGKLLQTETENLGLKS